MDKYLHSIYSKKDQEMKKSEVLNLFNYYQQAINTINEEIREKEFDVEMSRAKELNTKYENFYYEYGMNLENNKLKFKQRNNNNVLMQLNILQTENSDVEEKDSFEWVISRFPKARKDIEFQQEKINKSEIWKEEFSNTKEMDFLRKKVDKFKIWKEKFSNM
jgi:hypothetical protein